MFSKDILTGVILSVSGVWVAWQAQSFPTLGGMKFGPGLFPTIAGSGLAICGLLVLFTGIMSYVRAGETYPETENGTGFGSGKGIGSGQSEASLKPQLSGKAWINSIALILGVILFAAFLDTVGFHLLAFPLMACLLMLYGVNWWKSVLLAVGVTMLVHFLFYSFLHVPLPWGLLEPIAW
ncbi:tripartite tricarboxylate transporter TctB family protein [Cohaesibacter haloalkalitolerans]|uniref:tripartite tricarboxylate transporter TctB family protein n=1 Tax=Cohaesibacter haloalkalitolerans TaxID=1162980 RepID=UPI000E64BDC6|nr:tripartite tricarboxylate transporter TctB family protein [Cohaesibacter haloalkalitolerans]